MANRLLSICLLLAASSCLSAQQPTVEEILARYATARPSAQQLGMYRLDWADSLKTALERSRAEKRPVMLIIIHAQYGDITSGHC